MRAGAIGNDPDIFRQQADGFFHVIEGDGDGALNVPQKIVAMGAGINNHERSAGIISGINVIGRHISVVDQRKARRRVSGIEHPFVLDHF